MSIRFPKSCKTRSDRSAFASRVAQIRWDSVHSGDCGPIREPRCLLQLTVKRSSIDPYPIPIMFVDDGLHRRRQVVESGRTWQGVYGRKALVKWFSNLLKASGV